MRYLSDGRNTMADNRLTDEQIREQIPGARERARIARETGPRAKSVRYSRATRRISVTLTNDAAFSFPTKIVPGLGNASHSELAKVNVSPSGEGLMWSELDADVSVSGLLEAVIGQGPWMRLLGRSGGISRSPAKAQAARANGAKGGRPRASV